ncbi:glycosyltransferase family 2 protein, partial [Klebsiella pneumoniae]|nr:glycosyltransferase family 2 protein [Klebsiella pneumoniae]
KSYHTLDRSLEYNTPVDKRKHEEVCTYGAESGHSRLFLDFEWKILRSVCRTSPVVREKNPGWKARWWLRWLFAPLAK